MGIINALIAGVGVIITGLISLLPTSPFSWNLGALGPYWHYAALFIPIPEMITLLSSYLVAVALWYIVRLALRWIKMIG